MMMVVVVARAHFMMQSTSHLTYGCSDDCDGRDCDVMFALTFNYADGRRFQWTSSGLC